MKFPEFLNKVVPKIGPNSAFDISRDARIKSIENILIKNNITTQKEIEEEQEKELEKIATDIEKMPPPPEQ